jgi:putative transposase
MQKEIPLVHGGYYHIYNRGNAGENLFREHRNYGYFLTQYAKYIEPVAETFAYCLLRNHFHLLVRIRDEQTCQVSKDLTGLAKSLNPSQPFSNLFNSYTKSINVAYGRTGNLFQRPFGRIRVTNHKYFSDLVRYIHLNSQKHGFVSDFREYPYSSYQALCSTKPTRLQRDVVLAWFGGDDNFQTAHNQTLDEMQIKEWIGDDTD